MAVRPTHWPRALHSARQLADIALDFDCAASMPIDPAARQAMAEALTLDLGNPSSTHGKGQAGRALVEWGRGQLAEALGVAPRELVLTSGATEANALAWRGVLDPLLAAGRTPTVLTSAVEHASVRALAADYRQRGVRVVELPVDDQGQWREETLDTLVASADLAFVSLIWVHNETGVVHPVARVAHAARSRGALVHTDGTQAMGRQAIDPSMLGVDAITLSGHKFGGPPGTGALWLRPGTSLQAVQPGHQELGMRGGTENVLGIVGLGAAATTLAARLVEAPRVRRLRDRLATGLAELGGQRNAVAAPDQDSGHIAHVSFVGLDAPRLVMALDLAGLAVSAGSACASGTVEPSHVTRAMFGDGEAGRALARGAVRFSVGPHHEDRDVDRAIALTAQVVGRLRQAAAARHW
ncbi:MAG: cysteine desulfurase [Deltaproteobacteria bacterium]|nr:cysteine desulfurase [Deltaproteobacteria bacterium]